MEKAGVFEVALPGSAAGGGGVGGGGASSSSSSSHATTALSAAHDEEEKDELAGVGLAFYKQIYVLKVSIVWLAPMRLRSDQQPAHSR